MKTGLALTLLLIGIIAHQLVLSGQTMAASFPGLTILGQASNLNYPGLTPANGGQVPGTPQFAAPSGNTGLSGELLGDSTTTPSGNSGYALSGVTTTPAYTVGVNDPATIAAYNQSINNYQSALGNLPTQLQGSDAQIQDSYNTALQSLLGNANQAKSTYNSGTTQNQQQYVTNKNTIGTNAGQSLSGIERLLGSRGAGGSSAALFNAPQAIAEQATSQRAGAGQNYGANQQGLDTTYNTFLTGNQNDQNSIAKQRDTNLNSAQAQIQQTQAGLLQQLATLSAQKAAATGGNPTTAAQPFLDQANNYLSSAAQLGLNIAPLNYNTNAYTAPALSSYTTNPFATPTATSNPSIVNNTVSPALASLLKPQTALSGVTKA